jgi:hypothetical protein
MDYIHGTQFVKEWLVLASSVMTFRIAQNKKNFKPSRCVSYILQRIVSYLISYMFEYVYMPCPFGVIKRHFEQLS